MMLFSRQLFFSVLAILALAGCGSPMYIPNAVNSPMFKRKHELKITLPVSVTAMQLHTAYSVTDHLGVMANGYVGQPQMYFTEIGAGAYHNVRSIHMEVFGGYGQGAVQYRQFTRRWEWEGLPFNGDANYQRIFIQPAIGGSGRRVAGSIAMRADYVFYNRYNAWGGNNLSYTYPYPYSGVSLKDKKVFIVEPVVTIRAGGEHVKYFIQGGASLVRYKQNIKMREVYDRSFLTMGIHLDLSLEKSTKNQ